MIFEEFIASCPAAEEIPTEDVLASFLPLLREVIETHRLGLVAPLEGTRDLYVDGNRLWFEEGKRKPPTFNRDGVSRLELVRQTVVEIVDECHQTTDLNVGTTEITRSEIGTRGEPVTKPVYLPGYVSWEHELGHHDPLTDTFSLGLILASLASGLDLNDPASLSLFAANRRNLFVLNRRLHPVLAQVLQRLTSLDRRQRPQDLTSVLHTLENYRDQPVDLDIDLARIPGLMSRDPRTRHEVILSKLRERLFDLTRRNNLLHYRPTLQSVNLTHASIPLTLDIRSIREDQILFWTPNLQQQLVSGKPISLNKYLNFAEAIYLPSLLERIIADARRDHQEFGFAQLRLIACFLSWTNLKENPPERYVSPLVFLPVQLQRQKGIRDTYSLEILSSDAELNPVVRHLFKQLYDIDLPEMIDLTATGLDALFDYLVAKVQASEPAVTLEKIDRPRIDLVHEKARRRLEHYRRSARVSGRGVRSFQNLDYSYDPANYHPLGIKLFSTMVRPAGSHLRAILEEKPRPRLFAVPDANENILEKEKTFFQLRDASEENPYLWNLDFCSLTLANLRYRRMSLVRDYEAILQQQLANPAFETTFSLSPRPLGRTLPAAPPLVDRFDVVACDPTQATAVAEARSGSSYIIQGPPGTGKSQTITNLIADYVARGKRVLFVCEKRAAIDVVFARLRQCGLATLCSLIHDSQTDKKEFILDLKQTYELFTSEGAARAVESQRRALFRQLESHLTPLKQFEQAMEVESPHCALPLRRFLDRCVRLSSLEPDVSPEDAERLPIYRHWWLHQDRLANLESSIKDLEPSGILHRHPLRRLLPSLAAHERPMEVVGVAVEQGTAFLQQLVDALRKSQLPPDQWSTLERVEWLLKYLQGVEPLSRRGNFTLAHEDSDRSREWGRAMIRLRKLESNLKSAGQGTLAWKTKIPESDLEAALEQARSWEGKLFAWLSPAWWRLRKVLRRSYDFRSHTVSPTWTQVLAALQKEYAAATAIRQFNEETQAAFGGEFQPALLREMIQSVRQLVRAIPDWLQPLHNRLLKTTDAQSTIQSALTAAEPFRQCMKALELALTDFKDVPLESLSLELKAIGSQLRQVPQALSVLSELNSVPAEIGKVLRDFPFDLQHAEAAIAHKTWETVNRTDRSLARFNGRVRRRHVQKLERSYADWLAANADEILMLVRERFREHLQTTNLAASQLTPEQREFKKSYMQGRRTLEHEFGKTMRYKAIRELVDGDAGKVIRDLKPIWLMSPLSVSDTLPLSTDFVDVVIFDEASQVPLEESVPSLFRAAQVIVVGDEMQLPPTNFFSTKQTDGEDDLLLDEGDEAIRYELFSDSLLSHAAKNLPATMLGWHYRSRSESLISFSNWAFYDGRLLTVPEHQSHAVVASSASPQYQPTPHVELLLSRPVSFHFLPAGVYDKRRNRAEAEYIAELLAELLKGGSGFTIGIIAFSEAQQEEIESAINRLAADDSEFRKLLDEELQREIDGQFVGLLIKNLENIQGDERDVIILSICYGRGPNGKMLMNFGPINKNGGEKRLNVAFSRAKQFMAVVSSIRHLEITNDYNEGANCLKSYLRYAESISQGDGTAAKRVLSGISRWKEHGANAIAQAEDSVVEQVSSRLRELGYAVDIGVGQSHFRVDVAVRRHPEPGYCLGILVDTPIQYEQAEPLERDVMRPQLLRAFGWRIETVLAKDWYEDPGQELKRLIDAMSDVSPPVDSDESGSEKVEQVSDEKP